MLVSRPIGLTNRWGISGRFQWCLGLKLREEVPQIGLKPNIKFLRYHVCRAFLLAPHGGGISGQTPDKQRERWGWPRILHGHLSVGLRGFLVCERCWVLGEVMRPFETCKPPPGLAGWLRLGL